MRQARSHMTANRRRYVLASLSVQWRFRRMMRPAGLGCLHMERTAEGIRETAGAARERQEMRLHEPLRCAGSPER
jgi:hypothetical protein